MTISFRKIKGFAAKEAKGLVVDDFLGARSWRRSKVGAITGVGVISDMGRSALRTGADIGSGVGRIVKAAVGPSQDNLPKIDKSLTDQGEKFSAAMNLHELEDGDIDRIQNKTFRGFYFFGAILLVYLLGAAASLPWDFGFRRVFPLGDILFRFMLAPVLIAQVLRWGHLNWCVRHRILGGLVGYLTSGEWLPVKTADSGPNPGGPRPGKLKTAAKVAAIALILSVAVGAVTSQTAFAVTAPSGPAGAAPSPQETLDAFSTPDRNDIFLQLLTLVAPNVGPIPGILGTEGSTTAGHAAIADAFFAFSSFLLFIGSMTVSWHILAGTVASAHDGRVLGQRWHQIWAPTRVVVGTGMLAPIVGGYNGAQILVAFLVVWGGSLANVVWQPYVNTITAYTSSTGTTTSGVSSRADLLTNFPGNTKLVRDVFAKELCYAAIERYTSRNSGAGDKTPDNGNNSSAGDMVGKGRYGRLAGFTASGVVQPEYSEEPEVATGSSVLSWLTSWIGLTDSKQRTFVTQNVVYEYDYGDPCGKIKLTVVKEDLGAYLVGIDKVRQSVAIKFDAAREEAIKALRKALRPIAVEVAKSYQPEATEKKAFEGDTVVVAQIKAALDGYNAKMHAAAQEVVRGQEYQQGMKEFKEQALKSGWATIGTYYMTLGQIQGSIYSKAMEYPDVSPMLIANSRAIGDNLREYLLGSAKKDASTGLLPDYEKWWNAKINEIIDPLNPQSARAGALTTDLEGVDSYEQVFSFLFDFSTVLQSWNLDPLNPMTGMMDLGHSMLNWFWGIILTIIAGKALWAGMNVATGGDLAAIGKFGDLASGGVLSDIMGKLGGFMTMMLFIMAAIGAVHAYIIPMIPYISVMIGIAGLLVLLVEGMIAAPLWAFFHLRMDGQDFVDQVQRPGYMIAFNLILRPSLMVFGAMLSYSVFGAMAFFVNQTYHIAFEGAQSGRVIGPFGFLIGLGILTYIHWQIALRSFALITQVPDRVTRWFGQGGEQLGEEHENAKAVGAVVSHTSGRVEGLTKFAGAQAATGSARAAGSSGGGGLSKSAPATGKMKEPQ